MLIYHMALIVTICLRNTFLGCSESFIRPQPYNSCRFLLILFEKQVLLFVLRDQLAWVMSGVWFTGFSILLDFRDKHLYFPWAIFHLTLFLNFYKGKLLSPFHTFPLRVLSAIVYSKLVISKIPPQFSHKILILSWFLFFGNYVIAADVVWLFLSRKKPLSLYFIVEMVNYLLPFYFLLYYNTRKIFWPRRKSQILTKRVT